MFLSWGCVTGAEQDGKQNQRDTETQCQHLWRRLLGQYPHRLSDGADLQGDVGQGAHQHEKGYQDTGKLAAVAEGEDICQGGELIVAGQP